MPRCRSYPARWPAGSSDVTIAVKAQNCQQYCLPSESSGGGTGGKLGDGEGGARKLKSPRVCSKLFCCSYVAESDVNLLARPHQMRRFALGIEVNHAEMPESS